MSTNHSDSEFADDQHRAQAEEFMLEFGRFGIAVERMCDCMRFAIQEIFFAEGLTHKGLTQVVVGGRSSSELQNLLGALFAELRARTDEQDQAAVQALLNDIKSLSEKRNRIIHGAWQFGRNASFAELYATCVRPRVRRTTGAIPSIDGVSASWLRQLTGEANRLQNGLQALRLCIANPSLKVAEKLAQPNEA